MPASIPPTYQFEDELRELGFDRIAGLDEAGRGALAGPVVAAAVVLPPGCLLAGVRDSKLVPEAERETLYQTITQAAVAWGVGIVPNDVIDRVNILQATFIAMRQAIEALRPAPHYVLVDGRDAIGGGFPCRAIVGGDGRSMSIAAASLIAKVTRDRIMRQMDREFPAYGFARHKGYGTAAHRQAVLTHGCSRIHRMSFLGRLLQERLVL